MSRLLPLLLGFSLAHASCPVSIAQTPRARVLTPPRVSEMSDGIRVTVFADAPINDYTARREGRDFYVIIPRATPPTPHTGVPGGGLVDVLIEARGDDAVVVVRLPPGSGAHVRQNFNRLDIFISTPPTSAEEGAVATAPATTVGGNSLRIPRVSRPPELEEFLSDASREAAAVVTDFRQRTPRDGEPTSRKTTAYLSYDDANLYIIFVCADDPRLVRARLAKREDILSDDVVSVTLDTFRDRRRAYYFAVNPLGVQLDGITVEGQGDDYDFDTLWHSEGRLTPTGYAVRLAIPFKSLRFSNADAQTWGIALGRTITHNSEESYWPYVTQRVQSLLQQTATLEGLERVSPGRNVQLIPYGVLGAGRVLERTPSADPSYRGQKEARAGLDAKLVLRGSLTLDLTLNPDFSQVESDEPQVTVNRRFEVFFPEKRPFFIENAGLFQTPENLFFSRRVADPQLGVRLTGKVGRTAFGGLLIDDRAPGEFLDAGDPNRGRRARVGVLRLQREFGEQSSVGGLLTSYDFGASANRVFALDARHRLNRNWSLSGQVARSFTRERDGMSRWGTTLLANLSRGGRHFSYDLTYTDRSPGFHTELGFVPRVDVRQAEQFAAYRWRPERGPLVSFGPNAFVLVNWDRAGRVQDRYASGGFGIDFAGLTSVQFTRSRSYELFFDRGFRTENTSLSFYSDRLAWLGLNGSYNRGSGVNYFPAPGLEPFAADATGGSFGLNFRPTRRFRYEQSYYYTRLAEPRGVVLPDGEGRGTVFENHVLRSKLNYQFSRELSLRAILDYGAVLSVPELIRLEGEKRLTADFLLTYLLNPGTALYVGYTDDYENLLLAPAEARPFVRGGPPTTSTGRRVFVKLSYLFRY
ncbi:MAG TPA: DUF5916 domain-containing protein [Pyrinomonadaceae bacterium]|nr:DUF5916 domain-containing protein [Pyrinomonadaceae bacterium]